MYNTVAFFILLCGFKTWTIREQNKSSITSTEMKLMRGTAKHTWQDYKTSESILSKLKINQL